MSHPLSGLEPRTLWSLFADIAAIPRPSKHEGKIVAWIRALAEQHGWQLRADKTGNLVATVPASEGRERAATVILQAHLDMVCEKNRDIDHDFMTDPIRPRVDGDWVQATGTTLGADNGIGVAAALAAAVDPTVVHGPLELLFTLDEETGLTGAKSLDGTMPKGRTLINLDSEEDGKLFVGCAGGADCHLYLEPALHAPAEGSRAMRVSVAGLRGGHSGLNIHENRGNAVKLLTRLLAAAVEEGVDLELASLGGGTRHNAIPREAEAMIALADGQAGRFEAVMERMVEGFRVELDGIDEGLEVRIEPVESGQRVMQPADRERLLGLLAVLPHGVLGMSPAIPGLVETSSNLAIVEPEDGRIKVVTSTRSSLLPTQRAVLASIRAAGNLAVAQVDVREGYPGWKPDLESPVLATARKVYAELWDDEPEVTAVHAGLECGLLGQKIPGLDMISFGPRIEGAHSPGERVQVSSVERFWNALKRMLELLAAG